MSSAWFVVQVQGRSREESACTAACNDRGMCFSRFSIRICRQCIRLARKTRPPRRWSSPRFLERLFGFLAVSHGVFHPRAPFLHLPRYPRYIVRTLKIAHAASSSSTRVRKRMRFIWILLGCLLAMVRFCYCRRKFTAKELRLYSFSWSFSKYWM